MHDLLERVRKLEAIGYTVNVYPDAEEYINQQLFWTASARMWPPFARTRRPIRCARVC